MGNTSRFVFASLFTLYAAFWLWWGGSGEPLTAQESARYIERLREAGQRSSHSEPGLIEAFERLVAEDDGREYYMVNLMKLREKALYPPELDYDDDPQAAADRYSAAVLPALLKRGSSMILMAETQGRFLDFEGADDWDQIGIVRYRSRRDMLEFALELAAKDQGVHKWASLEKTHVFPVRPVVDFVFVRGAVAVGFVGVGLVLHLLLRRRARGSVRRA